MRVGQKGLRAVAGPFYRAADLLRGPQRHHLFRINVDLRAEAAADIGRNHAQFVLGGDVVERRQHQAGDVRVLRGRIERVVLLGLIVIRDRRARLHRVRHQAVVGEFQRHHVGGLRKRVLHRGFVAERPVIDHVARRFRVQLRCACLDRGLDVGDGGQLLIVDHHGFGGVAGQILGLRDHNRDRLADEAHPLRRHRRPRAHLHRRAVLRGDGPAANQVADLVVDDLLSRQHGEHARHLQRFGCIDALDHGVRMRAADEMGVGQTHQFDVVDVTALAGDETAVFLAHHACANAFNAHVLSSRPEFLLSRCFHRSLAGLDSVMSSGGAIPPPAQPSCGRPHPAPP